MLAMHQRALRVSYSLRSLRELHRHVSTIAHLKAEGRRWSAFGEAKEAARV